MVEEGLGGVTQPGIDKESDMVGLCREEARSRVMASWGRLWGYLSKMFYRR
jgi:hypothetical protein